MIFRILNLLQYNYVRPILCFYYYLKVTDLEMIVEKLSQEMENMKQQLSEERQTRQRLEANISSLK